MDFGDIDKKSFYVGLLGLSLILGGAGLLAAIGAFLVVWSHDLEKHQ
jgi:hypothetical protein